jgi:hypothetical protein
MWTKEENGVENMWESHSEIGGLGPGPLKLRLTWGSSSTAPA